MQTRKVGGIIKVPWVNWLRQQQPRHNNDASRLIIIRAAPRACVLHKDEGLADWFSFGPSQEKAEFSSTKPTFRIFKEGCVEVRPPADVLLSNGVCAALTNLACCAPIG